jgi:hypothetical protein
VHKIWCTCRRPAKFLTFPTFCCWRIQCLGKWVSCYVTFEILTAVTVENVFWAVTLCSLVEMYWLVGWTHFPCLHMAGSSTVLLNFITLHSITFQNTVFLSLLLVWAITSTLWFMLLQLFTYVLEARNNVYTLLDIRLLIYICIYHSEWSSFLLMHTWISCLDYLKMCYHKNNEVWKCSDFVIKVTRINWNQVLGHFFPCNGTLVFYVN